MLSNREEERKGRKEERRKCGKMKGNNLKVMEKKWQKRRMQRKCENRSMAVYNPSEANEEGKLMKEGEEEECRGEWKAEEEMIRKK